MEKVKFGAFRIGNFFDSFLGKKVPLVDDGKYKAISGATTNNGIIGYTNEPNEIFKDELTVANRGVSGTTYFQDGEFTLSNNAICLKSKIDMTKESKLYIASVISKLGYGDSYTNYPTKNGLLEDVLYLPMIDEDTPDWEYMDNYVKDVKSRRLKIIEDFVDKELTEIIEMKVLEDVEFGEFKVSDMFEIIERGRRIRSSDRIDGNTPFITAGVGNQGISSHIEIDDNVIIKTPSITIDMFANCFVRDFDFYCDDHVTYLTGFSGQSLQSMMYVCSKLEKMFKGQFDYARNFYPKDADVIINLPMVDPETPDWDFMDNYMKRIESEKKDLIRQFVENAGGEYRLNLFELPDVTFEDFRLGDYFEPYNISGVNTVALSDGDAYDYITRTSMDNGVHSKTGIIPSATLQPKGVFSLGLLGMDFFYRDREWYAGQFVRGIKPKEKLSRLSMTYLETILNKVSPELLGVLVRDVDSVFESKMVRLPSDDGENPSFEYMDKYIANIKCSQLLKVLNM